MRLGLQPLNQVSLRQVLDEDLPVLFEQQREPDAVRMAVVYERDPEDFAAHWSKIRADETVYVRSIIADGELAGYVTKFVMDDLAWVGYWIAQHQWGRGIATRALGLLLADVADRPLHASLARSNVASARVLERNGFVLTGHEQGKPSPRYPACEVSRYRLD